MEAGVNRRWAIVLLALIAAGSSVAGPAKAGHSVLRAQSALPRVVVLATGGTIASRFDPAIGALAPAVTGEDLVRSVPGLDKIARVTVEQISNIESADMTPDIWRRLSKRANDLLAGSDVSG